MVKVLLCVGKKKPIDAIATFMNRQAAQNKLIVHATTKITRTRMLRHFEEMRMVFAEEGSNLLRIDPELVAAVDRVMITDKAAITIKMSSFEEADTWLKWNIKERTAAFQVRGGTLDIEEEHVNSADKRMRICHYSLTGEARLTQRYLELLIEEKMANPKTVSYSIL